MSMLEHVEVAHSTVVHESHFGNMYQPRTTLHTNKQVGVIGITMEGHVEGHVKCDNYEG